MRDRKFYLYNLTFWIIISAFFSIKELPKLPVKLAALQFTIFLISGFSATSLYRLNINKKQFEYDKIPLVLRNLVTLALLAFGVVVYDMVMDYSYYNIGFNSNSLYSLVLLGYFIDGMIIFSPWFLLFHLYKYIKYTGEIEKLKAIQDAELDKARIKNLLNKLNPHFLFNTLNTIRWLILKDKDIARLAVSNLAEIMRYTTDNSESSIEIKEELNIIEKYLQIEKWRFEDLNYHLSAADDKLLSLSIPPFLILNLVENAITHGVSQTIGEKTIKIFIHSFQNELVIDVINNGEIGSHSKGFGLSSIETLVKKTFGEKASIIITQHNSGVLSSVRIPNYIV